MTQRAPMGFDVLIGAFIAGATVVAFDSVAVRAHESWISSSCLTDPSSGEWCCNHIDCREETVREIAGGYQVETGEIIPYSRVIWKSQDGAWWRCRNLGTNTTRCLIGPPSGS
jgi:hypothetical protein